MAPNFLGLQSAVCVIVNALESTYRDPNQKNYLVIK